MSIAGYNAESGKLIVNTNVGTVYTDQTDTTGLPIAGAEAIISGGASATKQNIYTEPIRYKKRATRNDDVESKLVAILQDYIFYD